MDKKLIDIKRRPKTWIDELYSPKEKEVFDNILNKVRMKVPQGWDQYQTLQMYDYFKNKEG